MSLLTPKSRKFRKRMRGNLKGVSTQGSQVAFGDFGMKAIQSGYISSRQLEAARKVIVRDIRKTGKLRFRVFPDVPYTRKGLEMPMGKGKGDVDHYNTEVRRGKILFEITGVDRAQAEEIFEKASHKLPISTKTIGKGEMK
ncbi:MAG TPA: 50S ribosomal protein L16 [Candidatus Absconditabacterales bacterium]|nr:50S ribosomal protein L16 [Candidatus Absconditabacterales bacterium]HMT27147.1 50S ribosomal protein L16 [Candidatus Absconditabacterales bacterium]